MRLIALVFIALLAIGAGAAAYLVAPTRSFDRDAAIRVAADYDARIVRDAYGVPHIYAPRAADAAFGLAYAHAEDDWKTIEEVLSFSRGDLGLRTGRSGAVTDYLVSALGVWRAIEEKYARDLAPETRAVVEAYAAGVNLWCAEARGRCAKGTAPVTGKDIIAGFVARTPFFYGLETDLKTVFEGAPRAEADIQSVREAFLRIAPGVETGSNAIAVAPARAADGRTRLMVNSHQPYEGPVAWYEARIRTEDGIDLIGGVFPGSPVILHGAGPDYGWAHTVNSPDLVDIYALEVDDPKKPTRYRMDGEWRPLERSAAKLRVKLFGPFSLPVSRPVYRSVHGPAFVTPRGVFAVAFAGAGDVRSAEQWLRMNKARNFADWRAAMEMQAIPSLNAVYADRTGRIAYYYNAAIPVRAEGVDWSGVVDGTRSDLVWQGVRPFGSAPFIVDPASGYVVNANHSPFEASGPGDNPDPADYPPHFGIDQRVNNRGLRIQELYGADPSITAEEFEAYKMDDLYAPQSRLRRLVDQLAPARDGDDETIAAARRTLAAWDGSTRRESRGAALAVRIGYLVLGYRMIEAPDEIVEPDPEKALAQASAEFIKGFGRLDPEWGEAVRIIRGPVSLPTDGGPDVLRAVYPAGNPSDGPMPAAGGDTYIVMANWPADGGPARIQTIHQFGAATMHPESPHYADQAPLFAEKRWRTPPMTLEAALAEATRHYRPGRSGD